MQDIYLITPTGGRPWALAKLAEHINRQTYDGRMTWIVADDCEPATPIPAMRDDVLVVERRAPWRWSVGQNTQAQLMCHALDGVPNDAIVIIMEDDDHYAPEHVANIVGALHDGYDLVGEKVATYYNVKTRRWKEIPGVYHASLCTVGVRGDALKLLYAICAGDSRRIDMDLWQSYDKKAKRLLGTRYVIGIKGLPGRGGIGCGHRASFGDPDPTGNVLRSLIGNSCADEYLSQ